MIAEALRVLLFGMLGIFLVMAIIYGVIVALSKISTKVGSGAEPDIEPLEDDVVDPEPELATGEYVEELEEIEYYYPDEYDANGEYVVEAEVEVVER